MNAQTPFDRECHAERLQEVEQRMVRVSRELSTAFDYPGCLTTTPERRASLMRRLSTLDLGHAYLKMDAKVYREHLQGPRTTIATFFDDLYAVMANGLVRPVDLPTDLTCDKVNQQEEQYLQGTNETTA